MVSHLVSRGEPQDTVVLFHQVPNAMPILSELFDALIHPDGS